jgi:hypothetical protein
MIGKANLVGSFSFLLVAAIASGQTPATETDSHIATAKTAAGQDYRGTFVNLCLPGGGPGGGRGAPARGPAAAPATGAAPAAGRGNAARGGGGAAAATPDRAGWYASPYKVFDNLYWLGTRQHSS